MKINTKIVEDLADEANSKGDNNLAILLYTFLGARKTHLDYELAIHCQDWAKNRIKEIKLFDNRGNN